MPPSSPNAYPISWLVSGSTTRKKEQITRKLRKNTDTTEKNIRKTRSKLANNNEVVAVGNLFVCRELTLISCIITG